MPLPALIGILNLTPDSFSDGGEVSDARDALAHMRRLLEDGADVVDIGAESTRPGATPVSSQDEWERLAPVLSEAVRIARGEGKTVSLDTRQAETASRGLEAGVGWINDVGGFAAKAMRSAVRGAECRLVVMHALGVPADPARTLPESEDPSAAVGAYFESRLRLLEEEGIPRARAVLDPGIGFGKTAAQSLHLLLRARELKRFGLPLLVGHSRKSFMKLFTSRPAAERDDVTLAFSAMLMEQGVDYLRVHDVRRHKILMHAWDAALPHMAFFVFTIF